MNKLPVSPINLSLVIPVYNERGNLEVLFEKIRSMFARVGGRNEVIFVDDGSADGSFEVLRGLAAGHDCVRVIKLARNYGQTAAMSAGIKMAAGKAIAMLDADLQNDPDDIPGLLEKLEEGYDLVSGWRQDRKDDLLLRQFPSWCANWLVSKFCGMHLHDFGCSLKVYRPKLLKRISLYGEMHRFIPALIAREGGKIAEMVVGHHPRTSGVSKYGIDRVVKVLLDLFLLKFMAGFSTRPIHFFGSFGAASGLLGVLIGAYTLFYRFVRQIPGVNLITLLIFSSMMILLGTQMIFMGLLGEISIRTYFEAQNKEPWVVDEILNPLE